MQVELKIRNIKISERRLCIKANGNLEVEFAELVNSPVVDGKILVPKQFFHELEEGKLQYKYSIEYEISGLVHDNNNH
jgi:hypothetical protein